MFFQYLFLDPLYFFRFIVIVVISVTLHELGHGWAAIAQGDDTPVKTGHMTANPVIHMGWQSLLLLCFLGMAWGQMPVNPDRFRNARWGEVIVAAAGPMTNMAVAIISILFLCISAQSPVSNLVSSEFFFMLASVNFGLCLFNFLPIPPLDGFYVASEFFPSLKPLQYGQIGYALLMILFVTGASQFIWVAANGATVMLTGLLL